VLNADRYSYENENITAFVEIKYSNVTLNVSYLPIDVKVINTTSKIIFVDWNQTSNRFLTRSDCIGENLIKYHSDKKPASIKIGGSGIDYNDTLSEIPSWNYNETSKRVIVKFSCD
jgi:hypothetical protein